jgi:hypothetical protein
VFAIVELLRGVAAFMTAPLLLHVVKTVAASPAQGSRIGIWICFGLAVAGGLASAYIFLLGRAPLRAPRLEPWLEGEEPALDSPPLLAGVRGEGFLPAAASPREQAPVPWRSS